MIRSAREAVRKAVAALEPITDTPELDAELLMAHALKMNRSAYWLNGKDLPEPDDFARLLARRLALEPIAYILGHQPFWSIDLKVAPGVLIPRADSETLIETALAQCAGAAPARILDLGSGPGTLLLAALREWPEAVGVGMERSGVARRLADENAELLGLADRAWFTDGDWTEEGWMDALEGSFDLILCNPPYIETGATLDVQVHDYEPHDALYAGSDGLADYRKIVPALPGLLAEHGMAILEIGWQQGNAVRALAVEQGFAVQLYRDLAGRDRALLLQRPE